MTESHANYHDLSPALQERILADRRAHTPNAYACHNEDVIRRHEGHDKPHLWRPPFVSDTEKIMHNTYYNRYSDKTQVFSLFRNDDISRRGFHVQLVSRIARNIGSVLNLNNDLIEAIALGHDLGHTPFGHDGEFILNDLLQQHTGRFFHHNVHSVRILDQLVQRNISLQTLDGVICHNGEMEQQEYRPTYSLDFATFDQQLEQCYTEERAIKRLTPFTLEGCVMRICDIIAYLGKDRQDAKRLGVIAEQDPRFSPLAIGNSNAEIINNLTVDIIEHSYGKPYLSMSQESFEALQKGKKDNNALIYRDSKMTQIYDTQIRPIFEALYKELLRQAKTLDQTSILYQHHIKYLENANQYNKYWNLEEYLSTEPNQIVVDYIASMTDDYLIELYHYLFPKGTHFVEYRGYFESN